MNKSTLRITQINPELPLQQKWLEEAFYIHCQLHPVPWSSKVFFDCVTPPYSFYIAQKNDEVVGYAMILQVLDEITLMDIATKKMNQNQGVATSLMSFLTNIAKSEKAATVLLEVRASNQSARHLYEKFGFTAMAVRKGYYAMPDGIPNEDAIVMQNRLHRP